MKADLGVLDASTWPDASQAFLAGLHSDEAVHHSEELRRPIPF